MQKSALFLTLIVLVSCIPKTKKEEANERYAIIREFKKEDTKRMKVLKKYAHLYKVRGKQSRMALEDFTNGLISYLDFLILTAPKVRTALNWLESNNFPIKVRVSPYLSGGKTMKIRKKNMEKGIYDPRMYEKRKKNLESRLRKKEPVSKNEISNIKYPL